MKAKIFPPTYLNVLLIVQIALHFILPIRQVINAPIRTIGAGIIVAGLALNIYSVRYLERLNTTSNFLMNANRLVVTGPFLISRNPIYLSGVMFSLGIAITLGSLSSFGIPILIFLLLNTIHIPNEESRLEKSFGQAYIEYKKRVRRWL